MLTLRTIIGALGAILAVVVGGSLWVARDAGPIASPPPVRHTEKPADIPPAPQVSDTPASRAESAGSSRLLAEKAADAPDAHPSGIMSSLPPPMVAGDFPPYLDAVAGPGRTGRGPRGCKSMSELLLEMSQESRDELWAPRMERELRAMLGRHPWGFQVSVGCRATICQITEVGVVTSIDQAEEDAWHRYWGNFMHNLRSSPIASEFATRRFFAGQFPADPTPTLSEIVSGHWNIAGYVLTSVGQGTPSEPPDCAPLQPLGNDSHAASIPNPVGIRRNLPNQVSAQIPVPFCAHSVALTQLSPSLVTSQASELKSVNR